MHHQIYWQYREHLNLEKYRQSTRQTRVMFAGNYGDGYVKRHDMLTRGEIVKHLEGKGIIHPRVDQGQWLKLLATADFFVAPPGVRIPLSHNIVEAMAVGTIPITNYPNWLHPPLRDGETCLAFTTLEELDDALQRITDMSTATIEAMRERVIDYYQQYLNPNAFMQRALNSTLIYVLDQSSD